MSSDFLCPQCGVRRACLLSTTDQWKYHCESCDIRFNVFGEILEPRNKLNELLDAVAEAKQSHKRACAARDEFLKPIVKAGFGFEPNIEGVYRSADGEYPDGEHIEIDYGWSSRGSHSSDSLHFPRSIVDASDPIAAATEFRKEKEARAECAAYIAQLIAAATEFRKEKERAAMERKLADKRREIERLQKELEG